jgi:hypothetical protein
MIFQLKIWFIIEIILVISFQSPVMKISSCHGNITAFQRKPTLSLITFLRYFGSIKVCHLKDSLLNLPSCIFKYISQNMYNIHKYQQNLLLGASEISHFIFRTKYICTYFPYNLKSFLPGRLHDFPFFSIEMVS